MSAPKVIRTNPPPCPRHTLLAAMAEDGLSFRRYNDLWESAKLAACSCKRRPPRPDDPPWLHCPECLRARGYGEWAIAMDPAPRICSEHALPTRTLPLLQRLPSRQPRVADPPRDRWLERRRAIQAPALAGSARDRGKEPR